MALIARILGVSLLTSALVAGVGVSLLKSVTEPAMPASIVGQPDPVMPERDYTPAVFILACVGGLIRSRCGSRTRDRVCPAIEGPQSGRRRVAMPVPLSEGRGSCQWPGGLGPGT